MKNRIIVSFVRTKIVGGTAAWIAAFSNLFMKNFLIFISFLFLLIISEYFLLNELFAARRIGIVLPSLLGTIFFIYAVIKFFKKNILPTKQS